MKFKDYTQEKKERYVNAAKRLELYLLNNHNYKCHLGFGSLLAAAREGKLIDGDYDIDLCVILPSKDTVNHAVELYKDLIKKGWLKRIFHKNQPYTDNPKIVENIFGQAHVHIDGFVIDLFIAWEDDGKYYTCQWGEIGKAKGEILLQLEKNTFLCPADYKNILTTLYGNWEIPSDDHPSKRLKRKCYLK